MRVSRSPHVGILIRRAALPLMVFALAVLVRLSFLQEVKDLPTYRFLQSDELAAHQAGVACMEGRLPRHAYLKAPLYTYFLAGVYTLLGPDPHYARIVQAVLCSLNSVLVYRIAERLFGWVVALLAGVVGAVYWVFVFFAVTIVDASLAALFYLLLAYVLVILDHRKAWPWLVAGVVMGLGAITRPNVLIFAPVLALAVLIITLKKARRPLVDRGQSAPPGTEAEPPSSSPAPRAPNPEPRLLAWRRALTNVAALTIGCCAVIAPVTIRNRIVGDEWVLIAAYGGLNLWVGNNPDSDGKNVAYMAGEGALEVAPADPNDVWSDALGDRVARHYAEKTMGRPLKRGEMDNFYSRLALQYIRRQPNKFIADTLRRFCYFFNAYEFETVRDPYRLCRFSRVLRVLSWLHFGVLCPLLVVGCFLGFTMNARPPGLTYLLLALVSMLAGGALFVMNSRFRMPLVYLGVPLAAYGTVQLLDMCRRNRRWSRRIVCTVLLTATAVLSNWDVLGYRPSYHTDLRFAEAVACWQAKRPDLMAEAAPLLEEALLADEARGCRTWTTLITHSRPHTLLFAGYGLLKVPAKTLHYGSLMAFEEPFDPTYGRPFFEILSVMDPKRAQDLLMSLVKSKRREAAALLLEILSPPLPATDAANANLQYARRYKDPVALQRTERILLEGISNQADPSSLYAWLDEVHAAMRSLGLPTTPATRPTTATQGAERHGR